MVSLVLCIPSWCWDRLAHSLETPSRRGLTIFYDGDCEFCRKVCLLFKTFLILPDAPILPAQEHPQILDMMERNQTWIVQDHQGHQHTKWDGVVFLVGQSPLFWPLSPVLKMPLLYAMGTRVYKTVSNHRGKLSRLTQVALPYRSVDRSVELHLPPVIEWSVGILAIYMVFINLTTLPNPPFSLSDPFAIVKNTLNLNQKWDMFAPYPYKWDGWMVIPGRLIDGTEVDVFNNRMQAPVLEDSSLEQYPYPNFRWRKYFRRLVLVEFEKDQKAFGEYLCRVWDASHQPLQHLLFLQIYLVKVDTPPPGHVQLPEKRPLLLLEQSCLKSQG